MRLSALHPQLTGTVAAGILWIDCPQHGQGHRLRIPIGRAPAHLFPHAEGGLELVYQASGEFPETLTVLPVVDAAAVSARPGDWAPCWRGHITSGEITPP